MKRDSNTNTHIHIHIHTHTQTPIEEILDRVRLLSYNLMESNRSFVRTSINESINEYLAEKRNNNE